MLRKKYNRLICMVYICVVIPALSACEPPISTLFQTDYVTETTTITKTIHQPATITLTEAPNWDIPIYEGKFNEIHVPPGKEFAIMLPTQRMSEPVSLIRYNEDSVVLTQRYYRDTGVAKSRDGEEYFVFRAIEGYSEITFVYLQINSDAALKTTFRIYVTDSNIPQLISPRNFANLENAQQQNDWFGRWTFNWSDVDGAEYYNIYLENASYSTPALDLKNIDESYYEFGFYCIGGYKSLDSWSWKVRAFVKGEWSDWSETWYLDVEAVD